MADKEEMSEPSPEEGAAEEPEAAAVEGPVGPDGGREPGLWRIGEASRTPVAATRAAGLLTAIGGGLGLDFLWIKKITGFGAAVNVNAAKIPAPGADPVRIPEGRFWLVNIAPGAAESPGGLLALYQKCPHLGCTVPWRPDFAFR